MPIGVSSTTVVNSALEHIASQKRISSLADGSPAAQAAVIVYAPTVQLLLRELDPAFARLTAALALTAGVPPPPWAYEYTYPLDCVRLRQVRPPASGPGSMIDVNDPRPVTAQVAVDLIGSPAIVTKVILTNQQNASAVYTTSQVTETQWDSVFVDAVVRRLANPLAMALSGRPDFAEHILQQAAAMAGTVEAVDEGGFRRF